MRVARPVVERTVGSSLISRVRITSQRHPDRGARTVTIIAWCTALILGLRHAWHGRHTIIGDAISYLDIGDAFARGDWSNAINAYWSPLYAWGLGLAIRVAGRGPEQEFVVIAAVNVVVYVFALLAFSRLLRELENWRSDHAQDPASGTPLPVGWWLALSYLVFIWTSLHLLAVSDITADMLFASLVYYGTTLLLRLARGDTRWSTMVSLGATLGIGYLVKVTMIVMSPMFLTGALLATWKRPRAIVRVGTTALVFAIIAAPFVAAVSMQKGRFTYGESPRVNLAWRMNDVPRTFWLGGPAELGMPRNPVRMVHDGPPVFEFARPIEVTYPPWHDPSHWYDGVTPSWNPEGLQKSLDESRTLYLKVLRGQAPFVIGIVCLTLVSGTWRRSLRNAMALWPMWMVAAAGLSLFAIVHIEFRYVGQYVALAMVAALTALRVGHRFAGVRVLLTILLLLSVARPIVARAIRPYETVNLVAADIIVARSLADLGVRSGDRVALLRTFGEYGVYWARLADVQIVAEIASPDGYWTADEAARRSAVAALAATGASVLVTPEIPAHVNTNGWLRLGETRWYAYPLRVAHMSGK